MDRLEPDDMSDLDALVRAATEVDGVAPLSEHARLHAARGGATDLVVRGPGGGLAAYAHLDPPATVDGRPEPASAELVVHPGHRRRGHGSALAAALGRSAGPTGVHVWAHGNGPAAAALAERLGARPVRELRLMARSLTTAGAEGPDLDAAPDSGFPPDLRLRAFEVGRDEAEWLRVNALAFAHHPEQGGWTAEDLREREESDWFDPAGFLLAEVRAEPGRIAGYHWTKRHQPDTGPPFGEVYVVGLDPAFQGRGLGGLLTLAGLRHLRSRGLAEVILYVDGDNRPALATYGRLGFQTRTVDVQYALGGTPGRVH